MKRPSAPPTGLRHRRLAATLVVALTLAAAAPGVASMGSARYRFEGNKWLALDLSVGDVRLDMIKFEWPATRLGIKTGYKGTIKVTNGSSSQIRLGLAVVVYDSESKLIGAGTTGTTLGTIDPGDTAEFSIDFKDITERLEAASQFQIALETR